MANSCALKPAHRKKIKQYQFVQHDQTIDSCPTAGESLVDWLNRTRPWHIPKVEGVPRYFPDDPYEDGDGSKGGTFGWEVGVWKVSFRCTARGARGCQRQAKLQAKLRARLIAKGTIQPEAAVAGVAAEEGNKPSVVAAAQDQDRPVEKDRLLWTEAWRAICRLFRRLSN